MSGLIAPLTSFLYKKVLKPLLFRRDPEDVHDRMSQAGHWLGQQASTRFLVRQAFAYSHPALSQKLWNIEFKNPVGLSAGFDKEAYVYPILESVGFGFSEIGTVTYSAYEGNPRPRLHRLPQSEALVVYYGLKSRGAKAVVADMEKISHSIPQVISIGRTNAQYTAQMKAGTKDYADGLALFIKNNIGDAYEINISCPNTFGGEPFTETSDLRELLKKLFSLDIKKPVFIKMPINLPWEKFRSLLDVILEFPVRAVTIGNLNKDRSTLREPLSEKIAGNISGKPTWQLSNELISQTYAYCGNRLQIIGVGGIFSGEDAYEKIKRGASLVELITGMIYEGPQLIGEINRTLINLLRRDGFDNISQAVGVYHHT